MTNVVAGRTVAEVVTQAAPAVHGARAIAEVVEYASAPAVVTRAVVMEVVVRLGVHVVTWDGKAATV